MRHKWKTNVVIQTKGVITVCYRNKRDDSGCNVELVTH